MRTLNILAASALLAALAGCSDGPKFIHVSGVVTLDGKPYPNAIVTFQPMGGKDNPNPGRGSSAYTDANGHFELMSDEIIGAVPGKHLVRIATRNEAMAGAPDVGSPDGAPAGPKFTEPIPPEWNIESKVEFDVPAEGTDKANFDIQSKKK